MRVTETDIPAVKIIVPARHGDHRGMFSETYNRQVFAEFGLDHEFVQDNQSLSADRGTLRGLHYQTPPFGQDKLVRVIRGAILDIAVDLRRDSPTFRQHVAIRVSAEEGNQVFVPIGFAHGFCTLEPDTEVIYKVTNYYAPDHDAGIIWNDSEIGIDWPVDAAGITLSDKDRKLPSLKDVVDTLPF